MLSRAVLKWSAFSSTHRKVVPALCPAQDSRQLFESNLNPICLCHISANLQEFQVLETLKSFELKIISVMVQPQCQLSYHNFVKFTRGSLKLDAKLLTPVCLLPQGTYSEWKGDRIQIGSQTVAVEILWLAKMRRISKILWSLVDLTKKLLRGQ